MSKVESQTNTDNGMVALFQKALSEPYKRILQKAQKKVADIQSGKDTKDYSDTEFAQFSTDVENAQKSYDYWKSVEQVKESREKAELEGDVSEESPISTESTDEVPINRTESIDISEVNKKKNNIFENSEGNSNFAEDSKQFSEKEDDREYTTTDEFRRVQEESRNLLPENVSEYHSGILPQDYTDTLRRRLGAVYEGLLSRNASVGLGGWSLVATLKGKKGIEFRIGEVNPKLFRDIFEINRKYLENGELVDLHDDYSECKCFISDDGLCGFAIEPDGNLISVFSLNPSDKRGFLYAIKDLIREEGATHLDCYNSTKQTLGYIYQKTIGFYPASKMDYNMEYDHDNIAKNHGVPQVWFMVNRPVEERQFSKDQYDEAVQYQKDQLKGTNNLENTKTTTDKIEDVGEKILGARKDMYREMAKSFEDVTEKSLVELPFAKAFKKPNLAKAVETGVLREKDAMFYETFFNTLINPQKPKLSRRMISLKARFPETETAIDTWAKQTHSTLEALGKFIGMDEAQRDVFIEEMTKEHFPNREQELAEIQARKTYNRAYYREKTDEEYDSMWGTDTTPNPIWVTSEVLNRLGYKVGDKVDLPFSTIKANSGGKGYIVTNKKGEYLLRFGSVDTIEEAIDDIVYLAKLKRGDDDIQHPITSFDIFPTKHDREETGEYEVYNNRRYVGKFNKEDADKYVESHKHSYAMPITRATRYYDYKISFRNALTGDKTEVSDKMFDTKDEARAYLEENYDEINENINNILAKEAGRGKKEVTDDDLLDIKLVSSDGKKWDYAVVVNEKYANNMGMPYEIKGGFENRKDAKEYLESIKDNVFKVYTDSKEQGKNFVYFDTGEDSRIGTDYRNGKDVTADDFMNAFGFRGVQFGNWTNQADRQMAVNQAYDAFMDLANLIGVSPKAISLNGELGIAFGARGSGSFNAHYERGEVVINLTKTRGAGSLAHEWWHALDNYFSRQNGVAGGMVTKNPNLVERAELQQAYKSLMDMVLKSDYAKRSRARGDYWGRPEEITARLLAEWVDHELKNKGEVNTFLSRGANTEAWQKRAYKVYKAYQEMLGEKPMSYDEYKQTPESLKGYPYPSAKEVSEFSDAMRNIFTTIQERETDNGMIALFQKALSEPYTENTTEAQRLATETVMQILNDNTNLNVHIVSDEEVQRMAESGDAELSKVQKETLNTVDTFDKEGTPATVMSSVSGAKVRKNIENTIKRYENIENNPTRLFLGNLSSALGLHKSGSSNYGKFEAINGETFVIRVSNHNATVSNFDNTKEDEGISIVISRKGNGKIKNDGNAHIVEFYYSDKKLNKAEGKPLVEILKSIRQSLYSGEYNDTTGLAEREEVNVQTPEFLKKPDGTVYGYTIGKDIYLTKEGINPNSPIHEYSHVWCAAVQENNPELWDSVKSLIKDTPIYDEVMSDKAYENIQGNFDLRSVCTNFDCVELTTAEMLTYLCLRRIGLDP